MFWHTPRPGTDGAAYEDALTAFHAALAADPPDGFVDSWTNRTSSPPWAATPQDPSSHYEDWYLVHGFAALDRLNDAAVSGGRRGPHDRAAAHAADASAGLYRAWTAGEPPPPGGAVVSHWLGKPPGVAYADWRTELVAALPVGAPAWQRQMVLGPTPEFCVQRDCPTDLPWPVVAVVDGIRLPG